MAVARTTALLVGLSALAAAAPVLPQDTPDLGRAVAALLEAKCAKCHTPESEDAKARRHWAAARDLATTVEEIVVPGDPDASDLYLLVDDREMPPEDSGITVSDEERALLAAWIEAGAPLPPGQQAPPSGGEAPAVEGSKDVAPPRRADGWPPLRTLLGRLHPSVVHFPIAFLLGAALAELLWLASASEGLVHARRFCVRLGFLSALVAAPLGWLAAAEHTSGARLEQHRWLGVTTAVLAAGLWFATEARAHDEAGPWRRRARWLLAATVVAVALAGHWGGKLTFGPDHLPF